MKKNRNTLDVGDKSVTPTKWEGYGASKDGRAWSRWRQGGRIVGYYLDNKWRELSWNLPSGKKGNHYPSVVLRAVKKKIRIHKLILETFVGPCPNGMQCRHLDGNKLNNDLSNLAWGTPKENALDRIEHGTSKVIEIRKGEANGYSKLKELEVVQIRIRYDKGERVPSIAEDFPHISKITIGNVARRHSWKHLP